MLSVTEKKKTLKLLTDNNHGDPLSMFIYAVATVPLITQLGKPVTGSHVWYADNASASAPLHDLVEWFSKLLDIGPSYGYYPEPKKCVLIVHQDHLAMAPICLNPLMCLLRPVIECWAV